MNASLRFGLTSAATAIVVLGLAVAVELIAFRHPIRKDLTQNQRHSVAEQTITLLNELETPVRLTFFLQDGDPAKIAILDLLEVYRYHSGEFAYEVIDPDLKPIRAREYNLEQYGVPVAFFETDAGKRESVTGIRGADGLEELLTNALIKITRGRAKRIYVLTGHGEAAVEEGAARTLLKARAVLQDKNYTVDPLPLLGLTRVPGDCDVLLVPGPRKELDPRELQAIRRYLEAGGRALVAIDPQTSRGLAAVMGGFGMTVGDDVIIDFNTLNQLLGGDPLVPIAGQYGKHAVTRNFTTATYFPEARSVEPAPPGRFQTVALVRTSDQSFAETTFAELQTGRVTMNGADRPGPITIAVLSEWGPSVFAIAPAPQPAEDADAPASAPVDETETSPAPPADVPPDAEEPPAGGRLAVFGDSDFMTDQHFDAMGNSDLFLNVVNWLAQEEDLIAIRPKSSEIQYVTLTATQARMIFLLPVVVMPGLVLAAGAAVWMRRRRSG